MIVSEFLFSRGLTRNPLSRLAFDAFSVPGLEVFVRFETNLL